VVVVGAGPVAASKLEGLLAAGARVTVVAPAISADLRTVAERAVAERASAGPGAAPPVRIVERAFEPADLDGAFYVVAAAPPPVNREVAAAAEARCLFVNAVDDLAAASAYLGGVVRRGEVTFAISTGGDAPALAGLLREGLDALLPADLGRWLDEARALRPAWRAEQVPMAARRPRLLEALNRLYGGGERS
jgi:uroporphyrin-III C-methyltransferase/precorrin-2 dehydrogenase/sirohydrochlorin ferrochelatase